MEALACRGAAPERPDEVTEHARAGVPEQAETRRVEHAGGRVAPDGAPVRRREDVVVAVAREDGARHGGPRTVEERRAVLHQGAARHGAVRHLDGKTAPGTMAAGTMSRVPHGD